MELRKNQNAKSHETGGKFAMVVLSGISLQEFYAQKWSQGTDCEGSGGGIQFSQE